MNLSFKIWEQQESRVEQAFPIVTLYHGTYARNLPSIQKNGIIPVKVDLHAKVQEAFDEVTKELQFTPKQIKELEFIIERSQKRLGESKFEKVYLSGERDYAISNAGAGGEWYEEIISSAMNIKYEPYFEETRKLSSQILALYDQIKKLDERRHKEQPSYELFNQLTKKEKSIMAQIRPLENELQKRRDALKAQTQPIHDKLINQRFGNDLIVITVEMPYQVFKQKAASQVTKHRIEDFERLYAEYLEGKNPTRNFFNYIKDKGENVWDFFQEVHLSSVEPQYIVKYETIK